MCLITFAWQAHPRYPLVIAANRDEFFARPTAPADWWPDDHRLAGRDLQGGGTWMGVSRDGRFAALTNLRDPAAFRPGAPSRGAMVADFLATRSDPLHAVERIAAEAPRFNGFNLLAGIWRAGHAALWIVPGPDATSSASVAPGVHGLSNARLDTAWPKVARVTDGLRDALTMPGDRDRMVERLFDLLADRSVADDDDQLPQTGVSVDVERALSAAFIRMPGYGTRASTVVVFQADGRALFVERTVEPDVPTRDARFEFAIGASAARAA